MVGHDMSAGPPARGPCGPIIQSVLLLPRDIQIDLDAQRIPTAVDALAVIEVADSSLEYDRTTKAALYARAGIAQYVLINLRTSALEVHEVPEAGKYARFRTLAQGEPLELRALPARAVSVPAGDVLP